MEHHRSVELADRLTDEYLLEPLDHEGKVKLLYYILQLQKAIFALGDIEHTNDWDWRIVVTLQDGTIAGTTEPADENGGWTWSDTFTMGYEIRPYDYQDGFAGWTHIMVEEFTEPAYDKDPPDLNPTYRAVPIDSIKTFAIYYE